MCIARLPSEAVFGRSRDGGLASSGLSTASKGIRRRPKMRQMSASKEHVADPHRLTRERIVDEALALVEREGADGLTMRNLGAALGVDPTAVYRHFRDKDELLQAMADRLFGEMADGIRAHDDWRDVLRDNAWKGRRVYLSHPGLARILSLSPETLGN